MSAGAAELGAIYDDAIRPALRLLPAPMMSREALVMLFAIGLQESRMEWRRQHGNGPARGLLQFEQGGGVHGVMTHPASRTHAYTVLGALGHTDITEHAVWAALETDDVLAFAFGRLLLWTDAKALPKMDNPWAAWDCYIRNWRPGLPHPDSWMPYHAEAVATVLGLFH